ncbi:MAG: hypothetical protein E6K54_08000 [Gammaproteobacteria bacterium]|nr:MAG: hypothetical protein E6K54_08000 [Gammaproteobacteria bacterium]
MITNPPSFVNAEDFARADFTNFVDLQNPESLDIFTQLNFGDGETSPLQQPEALPTAPLISPQPMPTYEQALPPVVPEVDTISVTSSLKKDIIKYLYTSNSCEYLKNAFSKVEDIDNASDQILYKKFKIGLVMDSMVGRNSSDKNLAKYVFSFFEVLLSEAKKFTPVDVHKYIDVFSESMMKDKITILNDSGLGTLSNILTSNNVDDMLRSVINNDSPSLRALKSSLQNISLLISLALTKKMFTPFLVGLLQGGGPEPPRKKFKAGE